MATERVTYGRATTGYSRTGFWLSVIAATIIMIQGFIALFFSSIVYALIFSLGVGLAMVFVGIILLILGFMIYSSAYAVTRTSGEGVGVGATIIVLSVIALFFGGGYIIGTVLGVIGGILVIMRLG